MQAEVNIGMVGHVDHGKTTLTQSLSGEWTDRHSEEIKRGISIRLGYASCAFRKCSKCKGTIAFTTKKKCIHCKSSTTLLHEISFVDSPGHETLMATMLSGAALMDGAILVIAANEPCPQPQTKEHLMALNITGVKNIIIVQNKIDLVSREKANEHFDQIVKFISGTVAEDASIIPIAAQHNANIDVLIHEIEKVVQSVIRNLDKPPKMYIARSFDVNKPGTLPEDLEGGVVGGGLVEGQLKDGQLVEIYPGVKTKAENQELWKPLKTVITSLIIGKKKSKKAHPGGLIGIGTKLDPSLAKSDGLSGMILGLPGTLPPVVHALTFKVHLLQRVVGTKEELDVDDIRTNEPLMLSIGTATTIGMVTSTKEDEVSVNLKLPVCADNGTRAAVSRRIGARWRLIGYGIII